MAVLLDTPDKIARFDVEQFVRGLDLLDPGPKGDADRRALDLAGDLAAVGIADFPNSACNRVSAERLSNCAALLRAMADMLDQ
jgi:hypothetical protein